MREIIALLISEFAVGDQAVRVTSVSYKCDLIIVAKAGYSINLSTLLSILGVLVIRQFAL